MTLLLTENSDLVRMVINSMRSDLTSTNDVYVNLALAAVANIGGREMSESLHQDVYKLLIGTSTKPSVKKRAALCLLRLFRKNPESLPATDWADKVVPLLEDPDLVRIGRQRPPVLVPRACWVSPRGPLRRHSPCAWMGAPHAAVRASLPRWPRSSWRSHRRSPPSTG